jgi:hypothetical protein
MRELPSDDTVRKLIENHVSNYINFSIVNMQYTNFDTLEVLFRVKNKSNRLFAVYFSEEEIEGEL